MIFSIVWILIAFWVIACFFYILKIRRIARSNRLPLFARANRYNITIRSLVKSLYLKLILATVILIIAILLAYFVRFSSDVP